MSAEASDTVTIPRAELEALKAELRRLRREVGRRTARTRIEADPGPGDAAPTFSRSDLAEAWESVSDRLMRFPGATWQEIESLPQPVRWTRRRHRRGQDVATRIVALTSEYTRQPPHNHEFRVRGRASG